MQKRDQRIEKVKLKNGLEVVFLFDKMFTTSSIQICFKIGWRHDQERLRGLAHLFEHLVGKRTKNYPGKSEFSKKLDELGIVTNAATSPDTTIYFQNQTHENIMTSLSMLFEAIYNTNFTEIDLQKEKSVVMNESREYLDSDDSILWRQMMMNLYPKTSMEKYFFGDEKTMENITLKEFEDFYNIYRNPKNSALFIGTDNPKSKKKILEFLNKFYSKPETQKLLSNAKINTFKDKSEKIVKFSQINKPDRVQANLKLGYKTGGFNKRERVVFGVANTILLGGFSGTIIQKLRDDMGLIYWMHMGRNLFMQDVTYVMFSTGCDKQNKNIVVDKIKECIKETIKNITQKDVDRTIPIKIYNQKSAPNVHDDLSELMDATIYNLDYLQTQEYLKILKTITIADVKKLMQKIFVDENSSVCMLD